MKKTAILGSIALTSLVHETSIHGGKKGIFRPSEDNPSIFFQQREDGTKVISLDIEIKETPNSKYGSTHMVKASVGKANRERLRLDREGLNKATPILGNLRVIEYEAKDNGGGQDSQGQQEGDMPEEFDGGW